MSRQLFADGAAKVDRYVAPAISYGVPALLFVTLAVKLVWAAIAGVAPGPTVPPDGYLAAEDQVHLYWRKGDHKGPFQIQVAKGTSFDAPVFEKQTTATDLVLPRLAPGQRYCWRVLDDAGARHACFTTSELFVPY